MLSYALALQGSTLYVGGHFSTFGSENQWERSFIGALDVDTGNATVWNPNAYDDGSGGDVKALAVSGRQVYAGGYFDGFVFGGLTTDRPYLASLGIYLARLPVGFPTPTSRH